MDDLIYDACSIFMQILMNIAPDHVGTFEFQLACYILSGVFVLLTMWMLYKLVSAAANTVIGWFSRGW